LHGILLGSSSRLLFYLVSPFGLAAFQRVSVRCQLVPGLGTELHGLASIRLMGHSVFRYYLGNLRAVWVYARTSLFLPPADSEQRLGRRSPPLQVYICGSDL
jgi:hypothetical protein